MAAQRPQSDQRLMGDDPDEVFDLVDERDHVIGRVRRGDAHHNPDLIHRSVQVLVFDRLGRLLLQRRSQTKDLFPGYYCASASGHVTAGDEYARRQTRSARGARLGAGTRTHRQDARALCL
jgi:isopentenyldiphosphate isomerase